MRLEEEYRRRLHLVTDTVRRQLDYQVDVEHAQRKFEQEHMVQWLEKAVKELVEGKQVCICNNTVEPLNNVRSQMFPLP